MKVYEAQLTQALQEKLIAMSADWERESSCHGYRKNDPGDIEGNRIFVAEENGQILGYLFGHEEKAKQTSSIMAANTRCFEVEELYVIPEYRSKGVGKALFSYAQAQAIQDGIHFLMVATATKDYKRILHFYIEELGMEFWSARLFKKL